MTARYYFWIAGTTMQKSQEGLLQSLIFEILRQCPKIIPIACPDRWQSRYLQFSEPEDWDLQELIAVMNCIIEQ